MVTWPLLVRVVGIESFLMYYSKYNCNTIDPASTA
jgi:hypothetical protein